jgi:hypothetical protein
VVEVEGNIKVLVESMYGGGEDVKVEGNTRIPSFFEVRASLPSTVESPFSGHVHMRLLSANGPT